MNKNNDETIKRYNQLLEEHGDSPKALGWTKDKEFLRFKILCEGLDLENATILDFGCGLGYFFAWLKKHVRNFHYTGIDINPNLIRLAQIKFPEAQFVCGDLFEDNSIGRYDYIFSSGVHNIKMENNEAFNIKTLETFSRLAIKSFTINFLSDQVEYTSNESHHSSPIEILKLCLKYSKNVSLRNDYMPFEFTARVNQDDSFDQSTVFSKYRNYLIPVDDWIN